ncbi:hypothetical protein [Halalkalibacter akibai]|uniref:Uncharacterized protein n=1 Tax=Halalkalibacter akibai (strain ATCC 43226 / DSM 21942 / CIP 109018 / JCM 9157 / 1139) TaxID=1236973 RepID=W4QU66_HALA3|nr:hypothetical protein [Halalkalibacter akibai]GAE35158.1 hypothetical protein JCM9157_2253 [Halalkalibacter akibai JCM 9157]
MKLLKLLFIVLLSVFIFSGAVSAGTTIDKNEFISQFEKSDFEFNIIDQVDIEINFAASQTILKLDDGRIHIFEFRDPIEMENESLFVSKDGFRIGHSFYSWVSQPHFYKKGNIIVLYVGENKEIIRCLDKLLGKPFAGQND